MYPQFIYILICAAYAIFGPYNVTELKWWIGALMIAASYVCGAYSLSYR